MSDGRRRAPVPEWRPSPNPPPGWDRPMDLDLSAVRANARRADTEDLLDRVTVYRAGMDPDAVAVIRAELESRGMTAGDETEHALKREADAVLVRDGVAVHCTFCDRPAVVEGVGFHRLWGWLPVFPRRMAYCAQHAGRT